MDKRVDPEALQEVYRKVEVAVIEGFDKRTEEASSPRVWEDSNADAGIWVETILQGRLDTKKYLPSMLFLFDDAFIITEKGIVPLTDKVKHDITEYAKYVGELKQKDLELKIKNRLL